ncbi:hypothetical protein D2D08_16730, partial [Salmonella enterica subsp. enterica serovar Widemarsh]|nr:hypothetical protein [Salmonella enterica subsp. enterica serovar Widemarsh]
FKNMIHNTSPITFRVKDHIIQVEQKIISKSICIIFTYLPGRPRIIFLQNVKSLSAISLNAKRL